MGQRYECKLPPELIKKAIAELNEPEDNEHRLAEIDKLRTRFEEQNDYELLRSDDSFILRFLRAKKFDQDKALTTLRNYHQKRKEIREVYDKVDNPELLTEYMDRGVAYPIRQKARDGSTVMVHRIGFNWKEGTSIYDQVAVAILILENLLEDESVQINGITQVSDYTHAGLHLLKQFSPSMMRRMSGVIVDTIPIRMKAIHLVHEYKMFSIFYAIAKPFIKQKIQKRMIMHGDNLTKLHEEIDPAGLPSFLAGTGPDFDVAGWKKRMLSTDGHGEETFL